MKKDYKEIAERIEEAIELIANQKKSKKLNYEDLSKLISETSVKYGISEEMLRSVGSWNLSNSDELIELWQEAEDELKKGNDAECRRLRHKFSILRDELRVSDRELVDEYIQNQEKENQKIMDKTFGYFD